MSTPETSAVPGEGIDLIGGGGGGSDPGRSAGDDEEYRGAPASGPHGCRTGSSALRVSVPMSSSSATGGGGGLATSAHPLASSTALRILIEGGNAFDAAVGAVATLGVVEPMSSSLAGNGYALLYDSGTRTVRGLNMVGSSPSSVRPDELSDAELARGHKSAVVPGAFRSLCSLLERHGTMGLAHVFRHATSLAKRGHPTSEALAAAIRAQKDALSVHPESAKMFLPNGGGAPPVPGQILRFDDLARTMERLVEAEADALRGGKSRVESIRAACDRFYEGELATEFGRWYESKGGLLTTDDLRRHRDSAPLWSEDDDENDDGDDEEGTNGGNKGFGLLRTTYRGYDVYANAGTARGGIETLMILNLLERYDVGSSSSSSFSGPDDPRLIHLLAECIKLVKADVYDRLTDPRFRCVPHRHWLSKGYAERRGGSIDETRAGSTLPDPCVDGPTDGEDEGEEDPAHDGAADGGNGRRPARTERYVDSPDTTSFSILDSYGNAVCCTTTIGEGFGTRSVVGATGLLFNDGMRIGSTSPYPDPHPNVLEPNKIGLINNAPILITKRGKLKFALGTPGGEAIGQVQPQTIINLIDFGMPIQEAIEFPRFKLVAEPNFYGRNASVTMKLESRVSAEARDILVKLGHRVDVVGPYSICAVQGIAVGGDEEWPEGGGEDGSKFARRERGATAGADPRGGYYAVGY